MIFILLETPPKSFLRFLLMAEQSHDPHLGPAKPSERISALISPSFAHYATWPNIPAANSSTPPEGGQVPQPMIERYGKSRRKKHLNETDVLAVIVGLLCLIAAIVTISSRLSVAWKLGLKRQVSEHCLRHLSREEMV